MQRWQISPGPLQGSIAIPPSKSHTLRAILFAALAKGISHIQNPLASPDTSAMIEACESLGARITPHPDSLEVEGVGGKIVGAEDVIQAGNSGIVARFIAGIAALGSQPIVITGDASVRHRRPFNPLLNALRQVGVKAISTKGDGHAPVVIQGPLRGGIARMEGTDSQPVSALLIAAALGSEPIELIVSDPKEQPWIAMTLDWLNRMGVAIKHRNYNHYWVQGGAMWDGFAATIPADFSSAAFPMAAALITQSELTLTGLCKEELQGDKVVIAHLKQMGAVVNWEADRLQIGKGKLRGTKIDMNASIDALPVLAVLGCFADGKTELVNGAIARHKESDRIGAICHELRKMGANIEERDDGLIVHQSSLNGAALAGHSDHRIALSLAVAALGAKGKSSIEGTDCVTKTYATFAHDFCLLGMKISEETA